ncbi:cysteine-rich CWC family protein [Oceanospirillum sediminis]|uniref:Cysteine-rich CWC family protein n=1 Tax=Oceanospirillum sediminis TaxID=2760088 RepID=A0A839IW08_9GAMM|nr:cysteine-rich CWC family protein [Oceanospirillum sediminis]
MPEHEQTECPRCGVQFVCKLGSYFICDCSDIPLSREQSAYLSEHWDECLCCQCLSEIRNNRGDITGLTNTARTDNS